MAVSVGVSSCEIIARRGQASVTLVSSMQAKGGIILLVNSLAG